MAGKLSTHSVIADHSSPEYTNLVDRGGLYHVERIVYSLFVTIKIIVYKELTDIMLTNKGANIELKSNLGWVCDDEVVQLVWRMISPLTIEDNTTRKNLLTDIIYLWITTRGYSMAAATKESVKKKEGRVYERKKGSSKGLGRQQIIKEYIWNDKQNPIIELCLTLIFIYSKYSIFIFVYQVFCILIQLI